MALVVTHIRFALDLKNRFEVKELDKYLSGSIYPDSRYITKVDRTLTHNSNYIKKEFYDNDDFKKGWAIHLICDKTQRDVMEELFPDLLKDVEKDIVYGNKSWVLRTTIKIIQDIFDAEFIGMKDYIKYLEYNNNPNNEDLGLIKKYNQIFIDMYGQDSLSYENEFKMWQMLGLNQDVLEKIKEKTAELNQDQSVMDRVKQIYGIMKNSYRDG